MPGHLLWLPVGVGIGMYAAPTLSEAKAQLVHRRREPDTTTAWLDKFPSDNDKERH